MGCGGKKRTSSIKRFDRFYLLHSRGGRGEYRSESLAGRTGEKKRLAALSPALVVISFPLFSRRLIQYRPGVHQAFRAQRFCPRGGRCAPRPGLPVNSRGRAQCSACRIKRKTNVNYGRIALQRGDRASSGRARARRAGVHGTRAFDNSPCPLAFRNSCNFLPLPGPDTPIFPRTTVATRSRDLRAKGTRRGVAL